MSQNTYESDHPSDSELVARYTAQEIVRRRVGNTQDRYTQDLLGDCLAEFSLDMQGRAEVIELDKEIELLLDLERTEMGNVYIYRNLPAVAFTAGIILRMPTSITRKASSHIGMGKGSEVKGAILYDMAEGFREFAATMDMTRAVAGELERDTIKDSFPFYDSIMQDPTGIAAADLIPDSVSPPEIKDYINPEMFKLGAECARDIYKSLYGRVATAVEDIGQI